MTSLLIDWVTIATAGATIDGRIIPALALEQMAEHYSTSEYTAVVNAEHWGGNFGTVESLRTNKDLKGRTILQAQIKPNAGYLTLNQEQRKQFFSIEFVSDFAKTGKAYLVGLALTDTPASIGTTKCQFTAQPTEHFTSGESFEFDLESSMTHKTFFSFFKNIFTSNHPQEVTTMTASQTSTTATPERVPTFDFAKLPEMIQTAVTAAFSAHVEDAKKASEQQNNQPELEKLTTENEALKKELEELKKPVSATQLSLNTGISEDNEDVY